MDSATPEYSTSPSSEYSTSPVHSALTTWSPSDSVVLPGTSGFSGSPMYMLKVPPVAPSPPPPPLPESPSSPPPQADSSRAADRPAATSADRRLLNFTCDASLVPRLRGERTGRCSPGHDGRAPASSGGHPGSV